MDILKRFQHVWGSNPIGLLDKYKYQPELTKRLDNLDAKELTEQALLEIVLWKVNRYPQLHPDLMDELRTLGDLQPRQHRQADALLRKLLSSQGIRLPMASTILRFLNPEVFQIIDDRVFRVLMPGQRRYPDKPASGGSLVSYLNNSVETYFSYLDAMHEIASAKLPFHLADRILYQLDIELGNRIGD